MTIEMLLAKSEIQDLLALYCRGVDRVHADTLRSIYHEDAIEDRGEEVFIGNAHEWIVWTMGLLPAFSITQHNILNSIIDIEDNKAESETYFIAYHRFSSPKDNRTVISQYPEVTSTNVEWPDGEMELFIGGRYLDNFERRNGKWKISYRKMICDWCRTQAAADDWFNENPTVYRGKRSISDSVLMKT